MKTKKNRTGFLLFILGISVLFSSCKDDFPKNVESPYQTVLKSIKIVNAGVDGSETVEGVVDENKKTISFPRLDPETNFEGLRFEAEMSEGATLDKESYEVPFEEGQGSKTIIVKVENGPRFREYMATIRLLIPVFGADFEKAEIYDYSNNDQGNPAYPAFKSLFVRGSGFDGEHVLIVTSRDPDFDGPHLLKVSDLKENVTQPIYLNMDGVVGGTFNLNAGEVINGHVYAASLSGGTASPLKIYHWLASDPEAAPDIVADINVAGIPGMPGDARHGDHMSINLDENGNGYAFFGEFNGGGATPRHILRLKITGYTASSEIKLLPAQTGITPQASFVKVEGTDFYLETGYQGPVYLVDVDGNLKYALGSGATPDRGEDARVAYFNEERYLMLVTGARGGDDATVLYVYDITKGEDMVEALQIFNDSDHEPVYQYALGGSANAAPTSRTGWFIETDDEGEEHLLLYGATSDAGFVLVELPKKSLDD